MRRRFTFDNGDTQKHTEIAMAHPCVITGGCADRVQRIGSYLEDAETIFSKRKLLTVHGNYKGLPVTAVSTGMGPASVSIVLPEVIEACDEDDMVILRLGTTGGLRKHLDVGDYIVSTWIHREEDTSDKIMGPGYHAVSDEDVRNTLASMARRYAQPGQNVHVGPTKVTNDIYFDALDPLRGVPDEVLSTSMEFSVFCALRDRYNRDDGRNIRVGNLLAVSNVLGKEQEVVSMVEFGRREKAIQRAHITAGLETLLALSQTA